MEAARKAFNIDSPWRKLEPVARGNLMRKLAGLLRRDIDYLSVSFNHNVFESYEKNACLETGNIE